MTTEQILNRIAVDVESERAVLDIHFRNKNSSHEREARQWHMGYISALEILAGFIREGRRT